MTENNSAYPSSIYPLKTAVLFLVFNRLDTTKKVFEIIRQARPPRLYIAADGARDFIINEAKKTSDVRDYIMSNIDWKCEIKTLFQDKNLGCKKAVSQAITWFFEQEEMGIILEDDCLPNISFFRYCEELLEKYQDNERVGIISGSYYFHEFMDREESYYFSTFPFIWGWASWRRVWKKYDIEMKDYLSFKTTLNKKFITKNAIKYWKNSFDLTYKGKINTWDYQFSFMTMYNNLLNIVPTKNLISNIGFGIDATHTSGKNDPHFNMKRKNIIFPLIHPKIIEKDEGLDLKFEKQAFKRMNIINRVLNKVFK